jgi:hypothetical protein
VQQEWQGAECEGGRTRLPLLAVLPPLSLVRDAADGAHDDRGAAGEDLIRLPGIRVQGLGIRRVLGLLQEHRRSAHPAPQHPMIKRCVLVAAGAL